MDSSVIFLSKSVEWETPREFFAEVDANYHFTLDVCARPGNAKTPCFFSPEDDGLKQSWAEHTCWMNPPYGREIGKWIAKAYAEMVHAAIVALLPARTDTAWFHSFIYNQPNVHIQFLKGRLGFLLPGGISTNKATFPSMLVTFNARPDARPKVHDCNRLEDDG